MHVALIENAEARMYTTAMATISRIPMFCMESWKNLGGPEMSR